MDYEEEEKILIDILKGDIDRLIYDLFEFEPLSEDENSTLSSLITVLKYHMYYEDFNTWFEPLKDRVNTAMGLKVKTDQKGKIQLKMISEHADGSALCEFEVSNDMKEAIISEGLNSMLIRGILNIGLDDMLRLAQRGQEEERLENKE